MEPIRVGVVGLGPIGTRHAEIFATERASRLVAACDRHDEKRAHLIHRLGCKAYSTVDEMLENEQLDLVSVCTAGHEGGAAHAEPTRKALMSGAHVLLEKPLSNRVDEAAELVRLAESNELVLAVNFNHRFVEVVQRAKKWIEQGKLGELLLLDFNLWVKNSSEQSAYAHLRELHPHSFDLLRYLGGDVAQLHTFLTRSEGRTTWSTCSINLRFVSGAVGSLHGSYDMSLRHPIERYELSGSRGRLVIDNIYEKLTYYPHDSDEATTVSNPLLGGVEGFFDSFRIRIRALLDDLQSGVRPVRGSGTDGLVAQQLIESAITSFETGSTVSTQCTHTELAQ